LTPENIFIEEIAYFSDLGFFTLKKIAALYSGYQNKSHYSSPEILKEKGKKYIIRINCSKTSARTRYLLIRNNNLGDISTRNFL
jgi:hypothetical protein